MSYSSSRRDHYAPRDHTYSSESEDGEIDREVRPVKKRRSPEDYYEECDDHNPQSDRYRSRDSYSNRPDRDRRHHHRPHHQPRESSDVSRYEPRSSSSSKRNEERHRTKRKPDDPHREERHRQRRQLREAGKEGRGHKLPNDDLRNRITKRYHENLNPGKEDGDPGRSQPVTPAQDDVLMKTIIKKATSFIEVEDIGASDDEAIEDQVDHVNNTPAEPKAVSRSQSPDFSRNSTPHDMEEVRIDDLIAKAAEADTGVTTQIQTYFPAIQGCRSVEEFQCMNRIEEGTYGVVYRAKCKKTGNVVALKRLKMEKEREGFPITSLREINTLMKSPHENIVRVMEIVVGSNMDKIFIVMEFVEHDLKSLMEQMKKPFLPGEVKTLLIQLLSAIAHLHDNWILHRDLKTSNLLLSHRGVLKVGDFGLAREYGSPLKEYTPVVVTLWYRAPELLLETPKYSTPIDVWSIGCIFGELLTMKPFFPGKSEIDQLNLIFKDLGTPSDNVWPGFSSFPLVKKVAFPVQPYNKLDQRIRGDKLSKEGLDLMMRFLAYCPERRISAAKALGHEYFKETPKPVETWAFPTWPARSEGSSRPKQHSPKAPVGGQVADRMAGVNDDILMGNFRGPGFSLKF